jgi:hypothetical protein
MFRIAQTFNAQRSTSNAQFAGLFRHSSFELRHFGEAAAVYIMSLTMRGSVSCYRGSVAKRRTIGKSNAQTG